LHRILPLLVQYVAQAAGRKTQNIPSNVNVVYGLRASICILLQVAVGLITAKASHVVWPPRRWQQIKSVAIPDRLLIREVREPDTDMLEDRALSPVDYEETLLNDISNNNCDNIDTQHSR